MTETVSINEINQIRQEFKKYLKETHTDWKDSTVSMHYSDAFLAFNNNIGSNFWAFFVSDEALLTGKEQIRKYLQTHKQSDRAAERADGYYSSMKYFKAFLDKEYPTLAEEWSHKTIPDSYMKSTFQIWMKKQKKSNGEPYSSNTISAYTTALKNSTTKLTLSDQIHTDLFFYSNAEDFLEAHKIILAAPNFNEVDIAAGNKAYSNGMVLYSKFLNEFSQPSCWIFQGNPKYYNVVDAINNLDKIVWAVNQYTKQIKKGDKAYIWLSGSDGGIIASGTIADSPEMKDQDLNDPYSVESLKDEPYLGVVILIERKLTDRIVKRSTLLSDERTRKLEILTYPGATNFFVTKDQEKIIESIIDGTYVNVAVTDVPSPTSEAFPTPSDEYTDKDFLSEVFMSTSRYETLTNLLKHKKNLILQGAPGVGKTYSAKRLAYSIMGKKDNNRVLMVQFHQSYSYEDLIMGYRPTDKGFELKPGPFYEFCKKAEQDIENPYFFIIDEINRGNLSKIFGELFMLIEKDKRGEELRLLYKDEMFTVPENIHIIGMMNTADRSLAMIDYALRRRFAFFELEPAFDSEKFKEMMEETAHPKFKALVVQIKALNEFISNDEALGDGFRIGHSYLCTTEEVTDEWLTGVVKYELLPLLNEYWFDEHAKIENWTKKLCGVLND
ncbi:MAG: EVE domain-containing protein [Clostridia bacterium]|nr:EVE domain-containing protein [Clostridia bacterium]